MTRFILLGLDGACPDIIAKATDEGLMPNFARLRAMGCWADNIPFPSAVTPGNWASIATGSKPATLGISDFTMHRPGAPLDEMHNVFAKENPPRAELLWDAFSDRGHKVATISYPQALPQTKPLHLAVGNYGMPAENADPYTIAPSRALVAGALDPTGPYGWKEYERVHLTQSQDNPGVSGFLPRHAVAFSVSARNPGFAGEHALRIHLGLHHGQPAAVITGPHQPLLVHPQEWTPFLPMPFTRDNSLLQHWQSSSLQGSQITGEFRLRITRLDLDKGDLLLYVSAVYPKDYFTTDQHMTALLRNRLGPYSDTLPISRLLMGWLDEDALCDEFRLQALWQARAALLLSRDLDYKAVFTKWHAFDKFYHFFMQRIDPVANAFVPAEAPAYERLHNRILGIADEMVGIVLDGLPPSTGLVVISDHGSMASRRAAFVNRLLARHGYIHYRRDSDNRLVIDWPNTRAFVSAFLLLNVNLKGRDPQGCVEPGEEYERVKSELIELLRSWVDPKTGQHVMSDVFDPCRDGAFYGLGSELDGDVRYFCRPGYSVYRSTAVDGDDLVTDSVGPYLGDHGSCRPTARFGRGSEVGIFYAAGSGFRPSGRRPLPVFPCDIVPTILHALSEPPLKHQQGAVLHDLLSDSP